MSDTIDTLENANDPAGQVDPNAPEGGDNPDNPDNAGHESAQTASNGLPFATNSEGKNLGYPINTSVKDMDPAEQAAYWKVQSRTWENRAKTNKPDPESNDEVERLQARIQELETAQLTEEQVAAQTATDQAIAAAVAETEAHYKGLLNREQLSGYARHFLKTDERVTEWLPTINQDFFLGENGHIDAEKVTNHFTSIYGEVEPGAAPAPKPPAEYRDAGQGRPGAKPKPDYKQQAAEQLAKRFPQNP